MSIRPRRAPRLLALLLLAGALACASIAPFSQVAYEQATSLKAEALLVMGRATEPYARHEAEVAGLTLRMEQAYEYARGRPKNDEATRQWALMKDPQRNLLGGFLRRWQERGTLSPVFIQEAQRVVGDAFDQISGLESGKKPAATP